MPITLAPLPYAQDALAPHMSAETLQYHHDKHHRAYVDALNGLIADTAKQSLSLEEIIRSSEGSMFDNAAQIWNHDFFWKSMAPGGGGPPTGDVARLLGDGFGSYQSFASEFADAATGRFGSGWVWLVMRRGKLAVTTTANADLPLKHGDKALVALDVWEHAYYIDHRNERPKYVRTFLEHLVNWDFVRRNLESL